MVWAPDYRAEYVRRIELIQAADADAKTAKALKRVYKEDCALFVNDMGITYDPRLIDKFPPFMLFKRQGEYLQFLEELEKAQESGLVEKCRDMGFTWLSVAKAVHKWLFFAGSNIGFGSRKENLVDKIGDADSILEKARMMICELPAFLKPYGLDENALSFMKIINPENGSIIKGEAGDNIGRGGRSEMYFKDESAHYERPEKIEAGLSMNTRVQIDISSVNGPGNVFYRRRHNGVIWEPGKAMPKGKTWVFIADWRDDPRKSQDWYDTTKKKYEDEGLAHIFAQEIDRDYSASLEKICIPAIWVRACIDAHKILANRKFANIDDDIKRAEETAKFLAEFETGKCWAGQDLADGGIDKNGLLIRKGVIVKYAEEWGGKADMAAVHAIPICIEHGVNNIQFDSIGVGTSFLTECNIMSKAGTLPSAIEVVGWNAGAGVINPEKHMIYNADGTPEKTSPKNEDYFANLKAQAWWSLRTRVWKTYKAINFGVEYPHEDLIVIPSDLPSRESLIVQLSQATYDPNGKGKIVIDKAPDGASSPNLADATVMSYFPVKKPRGVFDV